MALANLCHVLHSLRLPRASWSSWSSAHAHAKTLGGKDQIKNIILEQHTMEGELQKKLVTVTGKTKEEMQLLN